MSLHFTHAEMGTEGADERIQANAEWFMDKVLDPIRKRHGPCVVTSGYRPPKRNAAVGGKAASFHLFEADKVAADIVPMATAMTEVFNDVRRSDLPIHKVILEYKNDKPACIHIQSRVGFEGKIRAFVGSTGAANDYVEVF